MAELIRTDLAVRAERAVLVGVLLPDSRVDRRNPLGELERLAKTAGAKVVDYIIQRRHKIDAAYYIGAGKADEIRARAEANDAALVIFDNDLSPAQIRELEKITHCKILDRAELILDIFAARAQTHQARLQVELAQLEYTAPRLRGMWTHLERIVGAGGTGAGATGVGAVGGIGTRGPGERQIEIDRRLVSKRIALLKSRLAEIDRRRLREVRSRGNEYTIALVGYTNAGKSTLLNALTGAGTHTPAKVEDKLFTTLDTRTRKWDLSGKASGFGLQASGARAESRSPKPAASPGMVALVSDTVGFVRDLPHQLVASFRATLEETIHADLLIHVVDVSSRTAELEMESVNRVLAELGCASNLASESNRTLVVLNKCDAVVDQTEIQVIESKVPDCVRISAKTGDGLDDLREYVLKQVGSRANNVTIRTHAGNGEALAFLDRHATILDRRYCDEETEIDVRISPAKLNQLRHRIDGIEVVSPCPQRPPPELDV
ncbi:MAG: GTPase HflX [Planctomycetota bacterium]|nr:GTPase HflX [Planctomycetota bacterium]